MAGALSSFCSIFTNSGFLEYRSIMSRICFESVAEKKTICRSFGVASRMSWMSSRKPMSSMRSHSSRMATLSLSSFSAAIQVIDQPAGRADYDLNPLFNS